MLKRELPQAILSLHERGCGVRAIAEALQISRQSVRKVLRSGDTEVPVLSRANLGDEYVERVGELVRQFKGNISRVHEELQNESVDILQRFESL